MAGRKRGQDKDPFGFSLDDLPRRRFEPAIGQDFQVLLTKAETARDTNRTRSVMAYVLIGVLITALLYAVVLSTRTGDFSYLRNVWAIAGPFVGAMTAYYFSQDRKEVP